MFGCLNHREQGFVTMVTLCLLTILKMQTERISDGSNENSVFFVEEKKRKMPFTFVEYN